MIFSRNRSRRRNCWRAYAPSTPAGRDPARHRARRRSPSISAIARRASTGLARAATARAPPARALVRRIGRTLLRSALEKTVYGSDDGPVRCARFACLAAAPQTSRPMRAWRSTASAASAIPEELPWAGTPIPVACASARWRLLSLQAALLVRFRRRRRRRILRVGLRTRHRDEDHVIEIVQRTLARDARAT